MKRKIIFALFFLVAFSNSYSQKREKEAHYYYLSLGTCVYTNAPGTFNQREVNIVLQPTKGLAAVLEIFSVQPATLGPLKSY